MQDWFGARTFDSGDFSVADLARRKAALGHTVSVVLPARNEDQTIAGVVSACATLAGTLVDELVVLDGDSDDDTAELAAQAGARVHTDAQVLPEYGPPLGKGDALWRSLSVTSGDVVVFVDTDIRNPDPHFVWGLLGPLLHDPAVQLVKAFYDRPLEVGERLHPTGGGRVTELMARPLLNAFWPELAGLVQPLSGEYAARRELLELLPFFTGYGVEIGLLIDTLRVAGADAIAQVDLSTRVHRNQSLEALSRMAFGILQVALRRLSDAERAHFTAAVPTGYTQFYRDVSAIATETHDLPVVERPAHATRAQATG
ncbi:glucosyl-3-phosphoglycerate synthase [soil metagenome]